MQPQSVDRKAILADRLAMHPVLCCLDMTLYVDRPFTTNAARAEVRRFALADFQPGKGLAMLFALQTAWGFVHTAKDTTLMAEMGALLRHGEAGYELSPEKACECGEEPAESPGP